MKLFLVSMRGGEGWRGLYKANDYEDVVKHIVNKPEWDYTEEDVRKDFYIVEKEPEVI